MLIGSDFDKIHLHLFGFDFLEPTTFIGDVVIGVFAFYFANKTGKFSGKGNYFLYWKWFFIVFGISFLMGGFGHLLFNYWGVPGKYFSWYSGMIASFFIEIAFISLFPIVEWRKWFKIISVAKMGIAFIIATYIFHAYDLTVDQSKGLFIPTLNSIIGLGLCFGVLGYYYQRKIDRSFRLFWICIFIIIPSAFFQALKINFSQWFDRNDVSHILILISLFLYFRSIKMYSKNLDIKK